MTDLTKYFIDLSKCTEEEVREIREIIFHSNFPVASVTRHVLEYMIVRKFNGTPYLLINDLDHWKLDRTDMNKTELTYHEFIKLFEVENTTDHQGQPMTYWGGKGKKERLNSDGTLYIGEGLENYYKEQLERTGKFKVISIESTSKEVLQVKKSKALSFILGQIDKKIEQINEIDIAHTEGVLIGLKICKELWAQGTISHETIQEEIYHYQEELDNLNSK